MSSQQQTNLLNLQEDLISLKNESQVTTEQRESLASSMTTLVQGTTKPSEESVAQLSHDLSEALSDQNLTKQEQIKIAQDVAVVLNSANIPPEEVQAVIQDVEEILLASGVDQQDVQKIVSDLQAISTELQANL